MTGFWEHSGSKSKARQLRALPVDPALSSDFPFHHKVSALPRLKGTVPSRKEVLERIFKAEPLGLRGGQQAAHPEVNLMLLHELITLQESRGKCSHRFVSRRGMSEHP